MSESTPAAPQVDPEHDDVAFAMQHDRDQLHAMNEEDLQKHLQIQVVDMSQGAREAARDNAAEYVNQKANGGKNFLTRFVNKVWHGNLARDYHTIKQQLRGRREIAESGNIHALHDGDQQAHQETVAAVVERVANGHLQAEETQRDIAEIPGGQTLHAELQGLVRRYALGEDHQDGLSESALIEAKTRLLREHGKQLTKEDRSKGLLLGDNILEVARNAKAALGHGLGMERIEAALNTKHADVRVGPHTEIRKNIAERALEKLYGTRAGALVNETTLAAVVSVPLIAGKLVTEKLAVAAANTVALGAGSALIGGLRESLHIKQDRQTHAREMAVGGGDVDNDGKRRAQLEETRYNTVRAQDVLSELRDAYNRASGSATDLKSAIDTLATARTISTVSSERSIDLIQFSDRLQVEQERTDIEIEIARARQAVEEALAASDDSMLADVGVTTRDVETIMTEKSAAVLEAIDSDVSDKDKAFRSLRRKEVLKAATISFVTAEVIGMAAQETKAAFSDSLQGVFENNNGQERRTLLAGIFRDGPPAPEAIPTTTANGEAVSIGNASKVIVPQGFHLEQGSDGSYNFLNGQDVASEHGLAFNADGTLTPEVQSQLEAQGYSISQNTVDVPTTVERTVTVTRDPSDYIQAHQTEFTQVQRELWYGNNTSDVYDLNELGLHWGGENSTGVSANGDYVLSVSGMTPDGSFQGSESANAPQLMREGDMAIALSITEGTQDNVILVPINAQGQAVIEKDSFAAKALFATQNGEAVFNGRYAEAVQIGPQENGVQTVRMLATHIGEGSVTGVPDQQVITEPTTRPETTIAITPPAAEAPASVIEVPPVLPIRPRGGLEYKTPEERAESPSYGAGYGYNGDRYNTSETSQDIVTSPWFSSQLRDNPDAALSMPEEVSDYSRRLEDLDPEAAARIRESIDNDAVLKNLGSNGELKAIVTIPVYGAGEHENIYRTLSNYGSQPVAMQQAAPILLHVNWPEADAQDPQKMANINQTMAEIERARQDFPDLQIATISTEWPQDEYRHNKDFNGGIIRPVVEKLFDAALLSIDRAVSEGRIPADNDVLIIRNDADTLSLTRNYVGRMLDSAERYQQADAFSGAVVWESRKTNDYPGFAVSARMRELVQTLRSRRTINQRVQTIGMNMAVRASVLAAIGGIHRQPNADGWAYAGAGSDDLEVGNRIYAARLRQYGDDEYSSSYSDGGSAGFYAKRRRKRQQHKNSYEDSGGTLPKNLRPIEYVPGSQLDTLSDRLLKQQYFNEELIAKAWDNFSNKNRDDGDSELPPEDLVNNPGQVMDRIQFQINGMMQEWWKNPEDKSVVRTSLRAMFGPEVDKQGNRIYRLTYNGGNIGQFSLTSFGREVMTRRLLRDNQGRPDSAGDRQRRLMYNEPGQANKPPLKPQAMFVTGAP